jgi:5-methyltetrahydrofolate--homocysteine methyltransferase
MEPLLDRLRGGRTVVADGAWGTQLMERGLAVGQCPESFNLDRPEALAEIAERYLDAGAEILTTNTFGGSPLKLRDYGLDGETERINRSAVEALRAVAGERAYVSGSVGPTGKLLEPYGDTSRDAVYSAFARQIDSLANAGADLICVETMIDLGEARAAIQAAKNVAPELPVVAAMTFDPTPRGFFTVMGVDIPTAVAGLLGEGADVVGSNCGHGSETMVEVARGFTQSTDRPVIIQSNAGLPENRGGQVVYPETPEIMARRVEQLVELGVAIVGGCCGTTPDHIRAFSRCVSRQV